VLAGYGTGAVMAVPAHDARDFAFAKHFNLPIKKVIVPNDKSLENEECFDTYDGSVVNSDFINGLQVKDAIKKIISEIEKRGLGKGKVNFRLRDAVFGRQRYWGEPIPIYYKDDIPYPVDEKDLPVVLPEVDKYLPTEDGEPPLARATNWKYKGQYEYEMTTMPGWAGSSWYYLRYMDAHNEKEFASKEALNYWQDVDLYIGGAEHATGHLLYVRFWTKFLNDLGYISIIEPAKKLINQGMIQGRSNFVYRIQPLYVWEKGIEENTPAIFVSKTIRDKIAHDLITAVEKEEIISFCKKSFEIQNPTLKLLDFEGPYIQELHVDVNIVNDDILDKNEFKKSKDEYSNAEFIPSNEKYICGSEVEKMSKSKYNVVNPDDIIEKHGTDALRLYEMFLGPLELSKPWNTNGISGTSNFIRKLWRLFHPTISDEAANRKELKSVHKLIKKVTEDIERFSFNTSVSNFMICINELTDLKCNKREILEPLVILVSPYAPHVAEELWQKLGHNESITFAQWPTHKEELLEEDVFAYPISVNGKTKLNLSLSLALNKEQVEGEVLKAEEVKKVLAGQTPKKVVVVPGRIVNIVI
jgi:leucyl-tRNA synthetase